MVICSLFTSFMFRKREHALLVTSLLEEVQEKETIFLTPFQPGRPLGRQHLEQAHSQVIKGGNMSGKFLIMPNHHQIQLTGRVHKSKINLLVVYRESVNLIGYITRRLSADSLQL